MSAKKQIKQNEEIIIIHYYTNRISEEDIEQSFPLTQDHFTISKGLFISSGYSNYRDKWHGIRLNTNKDVDWSTISTLYRHPNIVLSRDKLSCLKDKYNIKIIRDKSKADLEIVSEKTFTSYVSNLYGVSLSSVSSLKILFNKYKHLFNEQIREDLWKIFDDPILQDTCIAFNLHNSYYYDDHIEGTQVADLENDLKKLETIHLNFVEEDNIEAFQYLLDNEDKRVLDTYVNEAASEDSIIINSEIYEKISQMLKSVNNEDVIMGMTMMANCNVGKSKTYLGLLFFHHMENLKHIKTWNQVGFKTLRKEFDKYMIGAWNAGHTSRYTQLIEKLAEDDALTIDAVESILDLVFVNVLEGSGGFGKDCAFQIDRPNVKLTEEYQKKIISENKTLSEVVLENNGDLPF
jgi:hypothetical protein